MEGPIPPAICARMPVAPMPRLAAVLGWPSDSHGPGGHHSARPPVRRFRAGPAFRRAPQGGLAGASAGAAAADPGGPARRARRARDSRGAPAAALARRDLRRLRQRAEPRHQPAARGAGGRGRQPALHRDAGAAGVPVHRPVGAPEPAAPPVPEVAAVLRRLRRSRRRRYRGIAARCGWGRPFPPRR